MQRKLTFIPLLLGFAILNGCANSNDYDRKAKNQFVTEFFALVKDVEKVRFKSYVGEGMAVGAVDGVLSNSRGNSEDMLAGAIVGAFFGGLLTAVFEGSTTGYEYQLQAVDGDVVNVIVDKKAAIAGDCVIVRVAGDVRISKIPLDLCIEAAKEYPQIL